MGPCLEIAERRARAYVRSSMSAAAGLTGLDVCFGTLGACRAGDLASAACASGVLSIDLLLQEPTPSNSDLDRFPRDTVSDKYSYFARLRLFERSARTLVLAPAPTPHTEFSPCGARARA